MLPLNLENKKILIVEDDDMNFIYLNQIFKIIKADVSRAKTGKEAIEKCISDPQYDLIMMDIQLPDIDGFEATKRIRKKLPEIPIIAQTAAKSEFEKELMLKAGCTDVIIKPFKMEEMVQKLKLYFD